jgi:hypothetical protein
MKKLFTCLLLIVFFYCNAQQNEGEKGISTLKSLNDQYSKRATIPEKENITIIYVPFTNEPFRVYDSLKLITLKQNVFVVGGFKNPGTGLPMPIGHLKSGFKERYGNGFLPVYLDTENLIASVFNFEGHAIIVMKPTGQVIRKTDYKNRVSDFINNLKLLSR